jgi:tryptophan-rich sensory protein
MATAAWLVWRQRFAADVSLALELFFAQLALNAAWSFIFFRLRRPGPALIEIVLLLAVIVMTMMKFLSLLPVTFWLVIPYVAWILYATFLNFGIWRLNRGDS